MKEMIVSGASPVLMPRDDPAGKIIFGIVLLAFLLICFVALMTFLASVLRSPTENAKDVIRQTPIRAVLTGLVSYLVFGLLVVWLYSEAFIVRLLETEIVTGFLVATVLAIAVPLLLSLLGAPAMFSHVGDQIAAVHGGEMSGLRRILFGALISVLAALFPVIGWFVIAPLLLLTSLGAFLLAQWRR